MSDKGPWVKGKDKDGIELADLNPSNPNHEDHVNPLVENDESLRKVSMKMQNHRRASKRAQSFTNANVDKIKHESMLKLKQKDSAKEDSEISSIQGLSSPMWKQFLFYLFCPTIIIPLLAFWSMTLRKLFLYSTNNNLQTCSYLFVDCEDGKSFIVKVNEIIIDSERVRIAIIRCKRYLQRLNDSNSFVAVSDIPPTFTADCLEKDFDSYDASQLRERNMRTYGTNEIATPLESIFTLFIVECCDPFYVFQYFSVGLWIYEQYMYYALVIFLITMATIIFNVSSIYSNKKRMKEMSNISSSQDLLLDPSKFKVGMSHSSNEITSFKEGNSLDLAVGDYIVVRSGQTMTCDVVLVYGECIVDENVLTGETLPVRKTPFEKSMLAAGVKFNPSSHAAHTLYSGTTVKLTQGINTLLPAPSTSSTSLLKVNANISKSSSTVLIGRTGSNATKSAVGDNESLQRLSGAVGIVCRTGFSSAKGQLIRAILFPKVHDLKYTKDALYFILVMGLMGACFFAWSASIMVGFHTTGNEIFIKFLDMVTIAVPPALACALSISTGVAVSRLTKMQVFVTDSERINWAGLINAVCFDKTGTLTESGLDFGGIVPSSKRESIKDVEDFSEEALEMLSCCHGLSKLDGKLVGDPLEVRLFETSGCSLEIAPSSRGPQTIITHSKLVSRKWVVERRFDFSSEKMRSGVVVTKNGGKRFFHVKGSPEAIGKIVDKTSLPSDYQGLLNTFTRQGLRVLAYAYREIREAEDIFSCSDQAALEKGMLYGGLILLANKLKSETKQTILDLHNADLKVAMITGDHIRTAVAVSYECGILIDDRDTVIIDIDDEKMAKMNPFQSSNEENDFDSLPLSCILTSRTAKEDKVLLLEDALVGIKSLKFGAAITGRAIHVIIDREMVVLFSFLIGKCEVFARMEPDDKALVVETLGDGVSSEFTGKTTKSTVTYYAAFCGDGANDIAALKSSMVGVSLCDAEASVAAPLTSRNQSPSIMPKILIEGRCSLVASFSLFKFIMAYAFVQVLGTTLLYNVGLIEGNWQYFMQDLIFTTIIAIAISYTSPLDVLPSQVPPDRFISVNMIVPILFHFLVHGIFQYLSIVMLSKQSWFTPYTIGSLGPFMDTNEWETNAVYTMALAQYVISALVMDTGAPFRKAWYTNCFKVVCVIYQVGIVLWIIFTPSLFDYDCWYNGIVTADPPSVWAISGPLIPAIIADTKDYGGNQLDVLLNNTDTTMLSATDPLNVTSVVFGSCTSAISMFCNDTLDITNYPMGMPTYSTLQCLYNASFKDYILNNIFAIRAFPKPYMPYMVALIAVNLICSYVMDYVIKFILRTLCTKKKNSRGISVVGDI